MMNHNNYHFVGMHIIWWIIWMVILYWIFASPFSIPGKRFKKETPLEILKKRLATGEISKDEYLEMKSFLEK